MAFPNSTYSPKFTLSQVYKFMFPKKTSPVSQHSTQIITTNHHCIPNLVTLKETENKKKMTLVRENKEHQSLRLIVPPPCFSRLPLNASPLSSASSSSSNSPEAIDSNSNLKKLSIIGSGNGGTVYKVCHAQTGVIYACKVVRFGEKADAAICEADILRRVDSSEYVVKCLGVFDSGFADMDGVGVGLCFVLEYMDVGSLHGVLIKNKRISEQVISGIARSVLRGLKYLHKTGVVHRDIKPSNLLVNRRGEVKIADFGASRVVESSRDQTVKCSSTYTHQHVCRGTCAYMSPERLDPESWDGERCDEFLGDVWSLGVVVLECYVGRFPLIEPGERTDWVTLVCAICMDENVQSMLRMASPEFQNFCQSCLEKDWRKRGTVEELISHPFVTNYDSDSNGLEGLVSEIAPNDQI